MRSSIFWTLASSNVVYIQSVWPDCMLAEALTPTHITVHGATAGDMERTFSLRAFEASQSGKAVEATFMYENDFGGAVFNMTMPRLTAGWYSLSTDGAEVSRPVYFYPPPTVDLTAIAREGLEAADLRTTGGDELCLLGSGVFVTRHSKIFFTQGSDSADRVGVKASFLGRQGRLAVCATTPEIENSGFVSVSWSPDDGTRLFGELQLSVVAPDKMLEHMVADIMGVPDDKTQIAPDVAPDVAQHHEVDDSGPNDRMMHLGLEKDKVPLMYRDEDRNEYVLSRPHEASKVLFHEQLLFEVFLMLAACLTACAVCHLLEIPDFCLVMLLGSLVGPDGLGLIQNPTLIHTLGRLGSPFVLMSNGFYIGSILRSLGTFPWGLASRCCLPMVGFVFAAICYSLSFHGSFSEAIILSLMLCTTPSSVIIDKSQELEHISSVPFWMTLLVQDITVGLVFSMWPVVFEGGSHTRPSNFMGLLIGVGWLVVRWLGFSWERVRWASHPTIPLAVACAVHLGGFLDREFCCYFLGAIYGMYSIGSWPLVEAISLIPTSVMYFSMGMTLDWQFLRLFGFPIASITLGFTLLKLSVYWFTMRILKFSIPRRRFLGLGFAGEPVFVLLLYARSSRVLSKKVYQLGLATSLLSVLLAAGFSRMSLRIESKSVKVVELKAVDVKT